MRQFSGVRQFARSRFQSGRVVQGFAIALLFAAPLSDAQAQFGKLKKIGVDAIKDKAKEKVGDKETPEVSKPGAAAEGSTRVAADSKPVSMTLNASQLDLMLAALTPMAADAEQTTQTKRLAADHARKLKLAEKCQKDATDAMIAKRIGPVTSEAAKTRARALSKEADRLVAVMTKAYETQDLRAGAFAQDSMNTLQMQIVVLEMGLSCKFEFTPPAVMETMVATYGMSGDLPAAESTVPAAARATFTKYQFALLRERIALFALSSADPSAKVGKEGVFTDDERAALTARAADIQKLTPYFKNGTLAWVGARDLAKW